MLKVYAADLQWEEVAAGLLEPLAPQLRPRSLYTLTPPAADMTKREWPPGFRIQRIDLNLLDLSISADENPVRQEIESCWTSVEHFLRKGFGYGVLTDQGEVVCWCTAEYVSSGQCGVGIETLEDYQGQGLAAVTAQTFLQHALSLGWRIHWDTWQKNTPSVRLAEALGFQKRLDYPIWLLLLD